MSINVDCETSGRATDHAELEIRLAVSTVPPRTTSFIPSTTELLATLPTRGCTRLLSASMCYKRRKKIGSGNGVRQEGEG